jgi:hypothetical protein
VTDSPEYIHNSPSFVSFSTQVCPILLINFIHYLEQFILLCNHSSFTNVYSTSPSQWLLVKWCMVSLIAPAVIHGCCIGPCSISEMGHMWYCSICYSKADVQM